MLPGSLLAWPRLLSTRFSQLHVVISELAEKSQHHRGRESMSPPQMLLITLNLLHTAECLLLPGGEAVFGIQLEAALLWIQARSNLLWWHFLILVSDMRHFVCVCSWWDNHILTLFGPSRKILEDAGGIFVGKLQKMSWFSSDLHHCSSCG